MSKSKDKMEEQNPKEVVDDTNLEETAQEDKKSSTSDNSKKEKVKKTIRKVRKSKSDEIEELKQELGLMTDKYMRISAEYDNYRKRTLKEKIDLQKTAGEKVLIQVLSVVDDFDRAMEHLEKADSVDGLKEGMELIYNKILEFIKQQGLKEIEAKGEVFDADLHEAVTKFPAPDKKSKGKVIDVVQKGYLMYDKVLRYPKVVVGE